MAVWPLPRITFRELSAVQEARPVALLTGEKAWSALSTHLALPVAIQAEPPRAERELVDYLAAHLPSQVEAVYAVGTGAPVEAAKVVAARNTLPLVIVPTALDGVAPFLPSARLLDEAGEQTTVEQVETGPAAEVVVDWSVIGDAPDGARGAGIVELLSIVTALLDWRHAARKGKNARGERFKPWAAGVATDLAKQAISSAPAVGAGDQDALRTLLDLLLTLVQLGNQLGHRRIYQGSEHYLADVLEVTSDPRLTPAERTAPCLLFAAGAHGTNPAPLRDALDAAQVPLNRVRATDFGLILDNLGRHLDRFHFPYSVLDDLDPDSMRVIEAVHAAGLAVQAETWQEPVVRRRTIAPNEEAPHERKRLVGDDTDRPHRTEPRGEQATRPLMGAAGDAAVE